jgi:hypothetical protein
MPSFYLTLQRETPILSRFRMVAAVVSFIIYVSAVVAIQQPGENFFYCERVGLAVALSNVVYQAPFGKVYPAVETTLLDMRAPAGSVFEKAKQLGAQPEDPVTAINDGDGAGFILVATLAMRVFGPHLFSIPFFALGLMAISAVMFLWRFHDDRCTIVTMTFFSLTLMLCTPLVSDPEVASQMPVGGLRYFSLLAILPAFHLALELIDGQGQPSRVAGWLNLSLLKVQVILLVLAIFVRESAGSLAGPILLIGLLKVWRDRRYRDKLQWFCRKASVVAMAGAIFVAVLLIALPSPYLRDGRATTLFWDRPLISLGVNPGWPFEHLRAIYDCTRDIPEGLVAGVVDRNSHCVWWHWVRARDIPTEVAISELYGSRYDAVMRAVLFNIVRLYPSEVLATLFYHKPKWIVESIAYLTLNPTVHYSSLNVLVIAGFVNFLGLLAISAGISTRSKLHLAGLGALFGISVIPSYLVAWALPHTTADLLFYCLLCIGQGLVVATQGVQAAVERASTERGLNCTEA